MKKKIFGALLVVAIAAGAMMNVNLNKTSHKVDLALANVEALAGEATYSCTAESTCFTWSGTVAGSVKCTGSVCSRALESVTCDGKTTKC